jgi:hypothetical protein
MSMATIKPRWEPIKDGGVRASRADITWPDMKAGDVGEWIETHGSSPVQVSGEFGAGAKCRIEGTHVQDVEAAEIVSLAKPGIEPVPHSPRFVRPVILGGDQRTSINVIMVVPQ